MKLRIIAIATVMTLGIGGAVVASNNTQTANVQNIAPEGELENWVPLSPGHRGCDDENSRECIGYQNPETGDVTPLAFGEEM